MDADIDAHADVDMDTAPDTYGLGDREIGIHAVLLMSMLHNSIAMCGYTSMHRCICRYRCACMYGY